MLTPAQVTEASQLLTERRALKVKLEYKLDAHSENRLQIIMPKPERGPDGIERSHIHITPELALSSFNAWKDQIRLAINKVERRLAQLSIKLED